MKEDLHAAIIRTDKMLQEANGVDCQAYISTLRIHLYHLINIAVGRLEQEMERFTDSPVAYRLPQEIVETVIAGENTKSQLPQDNQEAFAKAVEYADGWREWNGVMADKPTGEVEVRLKCGQLWSDDAEKFVWVTGVKSSIADFYQIVAWRPINR